jgi:CheY-like chemotaxis protein
MNQSNPQILCVDDEAQNLHLYEAMLMSSGYSAIITADGA